MNFSAGLDLKGMLQSALGSTQGRAQFELRIGPFVGNELTVLSFEGRESLNEPFVYDVVFSSSVAEDALEAGVYGLPACLTIQAPSPHEPRVIQGIAADFVPIGAADKDLSSGVRTYAVRIVPRLWGLDNEKKKHVFEDQSAVDLARSVLAASRIEADVQIRAEDYPPLRFEYQRNETDLAFLKRVLANAGIFFYFRHASGLLDQVLPGAGEVSAEVGFAAGALGGAVGAAAGVTGFVSNAESALGMTTTLVLADRAASVERLGDASKLTASVSASASLGVATSAAWRRLRGGRRRRDRSRSGGERRARLRRQRSGGINGHGAGFRVPAAKAASPDAGPAPELGRPRVSCLRRDSEVGDRDCERQPRRFGRDRLHGDGGHQRQRGAERCCTLRRRRPHHRPGRRDDLRVPARHRPAVRPPSARFWRSRAGAGAAAERLDGRRRGDGLPAAGARATSSRSRSTRSRA